MKKLRYIKKSMKTEIAYTAIQPLSRKISYCTYSTYFPRLYRKKFDSLNGTTRGILIWIKITGIYLVENEQIYSNHVECKKKLFHGKCYRIY